MLTSKYQRQWEKLNALHACLCQRASGGADQANYRCGKTEQVTLPIFRNSRKSVPSKEKQSMVSLKQNCILFSQIYISCQVRQGNLDDFFAHENQSYPPSISIICVQVRSHLKILEVSGSPTEATPVVETLLVDGAAVVSILKPNGACETFADYASQVWQTMERTDLVWDKYVSDSLKSTNRSNRGQGVRRRVEPGVKLPGDWNSGWTTPKQNFPSI